MKNPFNLFIALCLLLVISGCKDEDATPEVGEPSILFTASGLTITDNVVNVTVAKDSIIVIDYEISAPGGVQLRVQTLNGVPVETTDIDENNGQFSINVPFDDVTMVLQMEVTDGLGRVVSKSVSIVVNKMPPPPGTDPIVTGVTGTVAHGNTITLNGFRFGTVLQAEPLIWDDFEGGTHSAKLANGWNSYPNATSPGALYNNGDAYSGSLSAYNEIGASGRGEFATSYQEFAPSDKTYASYLFKYTVTGDNYGIMKLSRLTSNYDGPVAHTDHYNGPGDFALGYQPKADWGYGNSNPGNGPLQRNVSGIGPDKWIRVEMYRELSTPGVDDGKLIWGVDLNTYQMSESIMTRDLDFSFQTNNFLLGLMLANRQNDGHFKMYIDDVYVNNTQARVEIGNAATFSACTLREIQIPSSWTSNSIGIMVNKGKLPSGTAYLYVIDDEGRVNAAGYPITF